jgi:hypothetical protein
VIVFTRHARSEFGLVGGPRGLGAFLLIRGSAFGSPAHDAFMALPPYTGTREGQAVSWVVAPHPADWALE